MKVTLVSLREAGKQAKPDESDSAMTYDIDLAKLLAVGCTRSVQSTECRGIGDWGYGFEMHLAGRDTPLIIAITAAGHDNFWDGRREKIKAAVEEERQRLIAAWQGT